MNMPNLPKWPAMVVVGNTITREQAAEILIRTNSFPPSINDDEWSAQIHEAFGIPLDDGTYSQPRWDAWDAMCRTFAILPIDYLHNSRIASAYVGGPHGWCDWNGTIFTNSYNIGKYPSVEDVRDEWKLILKAFPFLNLTCVLFDRETCETGGVPIVSYTVRNKRVTVTLSPKFTIPTVDNFESTILNLGAPGRERGCSLETLKSAIEITKQHLVERN